MQKKLKILFIGLGSAGQRHLRILQKILKKYNKQFYCYRRTNRNLIIDDKLKTKRTDSIEKYYNIKNLNNALIHKIKFDIVYITNPISKHVYYALKFAKFGSNIFIEKPLSHNLRNVSLLKKIQKKKKLKICIGYQLRFHPGIKYIQNIIKKNKLGKIEKGTFHFGEFLPDMHKYEDYSKTHMAKKKQGGGAVLCLSHEVDLVRYLLGEPKIVESTIYKKSNLNIDVEDCLEAILKFENRAKVKLNINFLDTPPKHFIKLDFKKGIIHWNYMKNSLILSNKKKKIRLTFKKFNRNKMFIAQANNFINSIYKKEQLKTNIDEGIKTLKLCLKLKKNGIKK